MLRGRRVVVDAIDRLIEGARAADGGGLILRGEHGSGKTALLDLTVTRSNDVTVLRCNGSSREQEIPHSALHQLLHPLLSALTELPQQQVDALQAALGLIGKGERDRFFVPLSVLDLLSEHARHRPILILVDDAHLIDRESAAVIAFLAQRLRNESIALLMTAEIVDDYAFNVGGIVTIDLLPLDAVAVAGILFDRTRERPSPQVVQEVLSASLGNPKAATMLASSLAADQIAGRSSLPTPLPIAPSHEAPLLARLRELPRATQTLLLIAALEESGDAMRLFAAAQRLGLSVIAALEPAEGNGIIDVAGAGVAFREPLMRETVKRAASFRDRRVVHLALAALLDGEGNNELALWHRSQATLGVDERLAVELEEVASALRATSGCGLAAKVLQRAVDLSEDPGRRAFRLMLASEVTWMAGQATRALALADEAVASRSATAAVRVRASFVRGHVLVQQGRTQPGIDALLHVAAEADHVDPLTEVDANLTAAWAAFELGDLEWAGRLMRRAAGLPPGTEDRSPFQFGFVHGCSGYVAHDAAARVARLGECAATAVDRGDVRSLMLASRIAACYGDRRGARRFAERALRLARDKGANGLMPELLVTVAASNVALDQTAITEADAWEGMRLAEEMGQDEFVCHASMILAWVTTVQGRTSEAQEHVERCLRLATIHGYSLMATVVRRCVALLEMGQGNHQQAYATLLDLQSNRTETHRVAALWSIPDLVESGMRVKADFPTIAAAYDRYDEWVDKHRPPLGLAMRDHCRGLLLEGTESIAAFESALRYHGDERSFGRARTQLAYGEMLRRNRRRTNARVHLRGALETFELMGAAPWARRARAELRVSGESGLARETDEQFEMLTPQELQIAHLVGSGFSNREIGARLFLSHRTIEYHLHKMFGKLSVTSRAELVRLVVETIDLSDMALDQLSTASVSSGSGESVSSGEC